MEVDATRDDWDTHWSAFEDASDANPAQTYRRNLIEGTLELLSEGAGVRVIDFGSGTGALLQSLHERFPTAALRGLEYSAAGVQMTERRVPEAETRVCDLITLSEPAEGWGHWADMGVCSEVLEHLDQPDVFVHNMCQFLRPGARVIVTVPAGPRSAFDIHIGHRRHYTPESLRELLEGGGLVVDRVDRAGFPFFNLYRLMVMVRGRRLIDDAATERATTGRLGRTIAGAFDFLFRANTSRSRWGWQLLAVARVPAPRP